MKKSKVLITLFSLLALSACTRGSGFNKSYYKITFIKQNGTRVEKLYPTGYYPTPNGYTYDYSKIDSMRYEPSIMRVYQDYTYYVKSKITILNSPYGNVTKYFKYNETISFSDYNIDTERFTNERDPKAREDYTYNYKYRVTFNNVRDEYGNITSSIKKMCTYGQTISFPDEYGYGPEYTLYGDNYVFDRWYDSYYGVYGNFYYEFTVTHDMDLYAVYSRVY